MVFSNANKETKVVILNCDCGCDEEIHIKKYVDENTAPDYYLIISTSKFYSMQMTVLGKILHRLKIIWKAVRGKEYLLCDINMTEKDIDDLIKSLEEIKK